MAVESTTSVNSTVDSTRSTGATSGAACPVSHLSITDHAASLSSGEKAAVTHVHRNQFGVRDPLGEDFCEEERDDLVAGAVNYQCRRLNEGKNWPDVDAKVALHVLNDP